MKIRKAAIASVFITLTCISITYGQKDSVVRFNNIDVSIIYDQGILKKDPVTGNYVKFYEEREIKEISSVIIRNDLILLPEQNKNLAIKNLTAVGINGSKNNGSNAFTGGIIGFLIGAIPTVITAVASGDEMESGISLFVGGILTVISTGAGILIGSTSSTTEYKVIDLQGHDNNNKHKILIESLKKSKTHNF